MKLHEIELYSKNPETEAIFFHETLGLNFQLNNPELKVFNAGIPNLDIALSTHNPEHKLSLSFLVKDVEEYYLALLSKNVASTPPYDSHLGMKAIKLIHNGTLRIIIQSPTNNSPEWLQRMI